jgi:hypothetical protein
VGLERGTLGLVNTIEELFERKSSCSGLEIQEYGRHTDHVAPSTQVYPSTRSSSLGAISCHQKYLTLIFFACLQVGESTMANNDGFRLERIREGAQEKWRVSR